MVQQTITMISSYTSNYSLPKDLLLEEAIQVINSVRKENFILKPRYYYSIASFHGLKREYFERSREILKERKYHYYALYPLFDKVYEDFLEEFAFTCYVPCFNFLKNNKPEFINSLKNVFPQCAFVHIID